MMIYKNTTINALIFFTMVTTTVPAHAISRLTANMISTSVAAACSAVGYKMLIETRGVNPFVLGTPGAIITFATYHYLHKITPQGRLKRANALFNTVDNHKLAKNSYFDDGLFFDAVSDVYLTDDLPLISAYNTLIDLVPVVQVGFELINKALLEIGDDVELKKEYDAALLRGNNLFKNISSALKRIREHKDYLSQLRIYKEFLVNEKQAVAQEQMADAQVQMAHAQQSSALAKWIKLIFG
jgi:hypothetical protein